MKFLKKAGAQEILQSVPKPRFRDQRRQKEVEDIEEFFSGRKPDPDRQEHPGRDAGKLRKTGSPDGHHHAQTQGPRVSIGRRPASYFSWSSSGHSPTREEGRPDVRSAEPVLPLLSSGLSPLPTNYSPIPEPFFQSLVKTGIFRPLSLPKHHLLFQGVGHAFEGYPSDRHKALETPKHLENAAYVIRKGDLSQLPERLSQPPDRPRSLRSEAPGAQRAPSSLFHGDGSRHLPPERNRTQWAVPAVRPAVSPANLRFSGGLRPGVVVPRRSVPPPPREYSVSKYGDPATIPLPAIRPQSAHNSGRMSSVWDAGWLLNTSPPNHDPCHQLSNRHTPQGVSRYHDTAPEAYARERDITPPRQVGQESAHYYTEDLGRQKVLELDHEDDRSAAPSLDAGRQEPYLAPFFRDGQASGFVPAFNLGASDRASWGPQSTRNSVRLQASTVGMAPQHTPRQPLDLAHPGGQAGNAVENVRPGARWTDGYGGYGADGMARYWKPNTYGL